MNKKNAAILRLLCSILMLTTVYAVPLPAFSQDITSGLVGRWTLDEYGGTTAADTSGNANNGSMQGGLDGTTSTTGKFKNTLQFDGIDDYVEIPDSDDYSFTDGAGNDQPFSVAFWVKINSNSAVINKSLSAGTQQEWEININSSGSVGFYLYTPDYTTSVTMESDNGIIKNNLWHHVGFTYDGSESYNGMSIYVDGRKITNVYDNSYGAYPGMTNGTAPLQINRGPTGIISGASVDDVRVYNRELSPADISELFQSIPGSLRYKGSTEGIEYFNAEEWIHAGLGSYQPNAVSFIDSENDQLGTNGTPLQNVQDTNKVTGSFWIRRRSLAQDDHIFTSDTQTGGFRIHLSSGNSLRFTADNSSSTEILSASSSDIDDLNWHHVLFSFNLSDPTKRHVYIDDVAASTSYTVYTNDLMYWTDPGVELASNANGLDADLADFWIETGQYIDFTVEANRRKFISSNGIPMYLGPDGSIPLGKSPDMFFTGDTDDWHNNKGTGGGFTEYGALSTATSFPGDNEPSMSWTLQGTELNITIGQPTLTHLDANTIAFIDSAQEDLRTYRWDGSNWAQIGNDLNIAGVGNPSLTKIDLNTVAFIDRDLDELRTYGWNGSDWSQRGSALAIANLNNDVAIEQITTNTVAYVDATNKELRTYSWNGSNWSQVGSSLNVGNIFDPKMTLIDTNTVALYGSLVPNGVRTFEWSGSAWSVVGNDLAEGFSKAELTTLSTNRIALYGEATNELRVYDWDGTDWTQVGTGLNISQAFSAFTAMGTIDRNTISFIDAANDALRTYSFEDITPCSAPTGQPGDLIYNSDQNVMQYCNGTDWVAMGPAGITSGSGCSDPAGVTGDLIYNEDYNIMQYCNSDEWIGIALNDTTTNLAVASLVAHWTLDESSGTTVIDATGNHNGTSSDASPTWLPSEGVIGGALDIDSDETIDTGAWDVNGTGLTLAGWLFLESNTNDPRIICKTSGFTDSDADWCWLYDDSTGEMELRLTTVNGYEDQRTTNLEYFNDYGNEWHHFAITYDAASGGIVFYLDGNEFSTATHSFGGAVITGSGETVALGNNSVGGLREWDGLLDDLRVYDAPLTAAQILDIYEQSVPTTLSDNLIGHWTLDETSGTTANDISGNSFDGTMNGGLDAGTDSVSGQVSTALDFDGNDGIDISNNAALENFSEFTLVAWVYPTSNAQSAGSRVISKSDGGSADDYNLGYGNSNTSWFRLATDGGSQTEMLGNVLPQNQWTQIVGTWNGQNMRLFENGVEVPGSPLSKTGTLDASGTALTIGRHATSPTNRYFPGRIDDARVYDRALSAGEVKLLYEATQ